MLKLRYAPRLGWLPQKTMDVSMRNLRYRLQISGIELLYFLGTLAIACGPAHATLTDLGIFPDTEVTLSTPPAAGPLTTPGQPIYGGIGATIASQSGNSSNSPWEWSSGGGYWFGSSPAWGGIPPTTNTDPRCLGPDCSWYLDPQKLTAQLSNSGLGHYPIERTMGQGGYQGDPSGAYPYYSNGQGHSGVVTWGGSIEVRRSAIGGGEPLKNPERIVIPVRVCMQAPNSSGGYYVSSCHPPSEGDQTTNVARLVITVPAFTDAGPVCTLFPWSPSSITLNGVYNSSNDQPNPSGGWQATGDVQHSTISVLCSGAPGSIGMNLKYNGFESPQADRDNSADGMVFPFTGLPNLGIVTKWNILTESVGGCFSNYTSAPGQWMLVNCTVAPVISDVATSDAMISGFPDVIVNNFSSSSSFPAEFKWGVDIIGYRRPPSSTGPGIPGKVSGTASGTIMMSVTVQ